jgi:hypothetical protein
MVQFIEGQDCQHLRGQQVTVQARVQCSAAATIKIGVLQWDGTEDQPTNDPVDSWAATPTWAASYSLAGSGSAALAASTWSDLRATFTLNSSFNNLAIIVWSSDALAQNATLDLSAMQIERGATATPFEVRPIAAELALCQRYFERQRYDRLAPVQAGVCFNADRIIAPLLYARKRVAPTIAESGQWVGNATAANRGAVTLSFEGMSPISAKMNADKTSEFVAGHGAYIASDLDGSYFDIDAEL